MDTEMKAKALTAGTCAQKSKDGVQLLCGDAPVVGQLREGSRKDWIPLLRLSGGEGRGFYESGSEESASTCSTSVTPSLVWFC